MPHNDGFVFDQLPSPFSFSYEIILIKLKVCNKLSMHATCYDEHVRTSFLHPLSSCLIMARFYSFLFLLVSFNLYAQNNSTPLPTATAESRGFSHNFLNAIGNKAAKNVSNLGAFLVWRHDALIYEGYFHGFTCDSIFNVKSASKSFLSAIAGAAKQRGYLPNLDTPVLAILPEYAKPSRHTPTNWFANDMFGDDTTRARLTLRNLLTMQTGLEWDDFGELVDAFVCSSDPVRFTLDIEFAELPGKTFNYCSGGTHTFGVALARMIPGDLWKFADSTIFAPAGITLHRWNTDPMGRYIGGCDMYFTPQDMMRFGLLYLHKGKANGKQILSESWIEESTAEQAKLKYWDVLPGADGYGYYWWRRKSHGHQIYVASGICGQLICIIPDLDMVMVTACACGEKNGRPEIKKLHLLMDEIIKATR
ncbi:MAG: serine hydrolase [Bacteroidota bacterium]|nr:serine hydrolase [Bacteroidota bacterium]